MSSYSGLYDGVYGTPYAALASTIAKGNGYVALARVLSRKSYGRAVLREIAYSLVDGAVGDNATATHVRRAAEVVRDGIAYGGVAEMETFTGINRNTVAADETRLLAALRQAAAPSSYPADASGNGGGGKLGF